MIQMIQCTKWFEWYNDPNDTMVWLIDKNELVEFSKNSKFMKWSKWYYDLNDTMYNMNMIGMIQWSKW